MITIKNIGPYGGPSEEECNYELRINDALMVKFQHRPSDGLAICLRQAADAYQHKVAGLSPFAFTTVDPVRDWPWGTGDNDNYHNVCCTCKKPYRGHKRSLTCYKCQKEADIWWAAKTPEEQEAHLKKVAEEIEAFTKSHTTKTHAPEIPFNG